MQVANYKQIERRKKHGERMRYCERHAFESLKIECFCIVNKFSKILMLKLTSTQWRLLIWHLFLKEASQPY